MLLLGHCANTPITLTISSISSPLVIDYQRGNTYYYALYGDNNDATYCQSGYKFKVYIVDPNGMQYRISHYKLLIVLIQL